jgi:hypothetical protein
MKKAATLAAFAALTVASPAASITVLNSDFVDAHGVDPTNWTTTDPWGNIYTWNDGAGGLPDSVLAFMAPTNTSIIEQNLSSNNIGLTAASYGTWNVAFDYGWRTNTSGGAAAFTVSLINLSDNSVLDSEIITVPISGAVSNVYTVMGTAALSFSYDNTVPGLEAHNIALRIQRTDAGELGDNKWQSTAFIDSVSVSATGVDPSLQIASNFTFTNHGASESFQLPFSNGGESQSLTISTVTPGGADAAYFVIDSVTSPVAVAGNGTINFTFNPTESGPYVAQFTIASNDSATPSKVVNLTVDVTDPHISGVPNTVDFGTFSPSPGAQTVNVPVTNSGATQDLIINSATLLRGGNKITVTTVPASIATGVTANIVLTFDPGADCGNFGDILRIQTNDANIPFVNIPVIAKVTPAGAATSLVIPNGDFAANNWNSGASTAPQNWISGLVGTSGNYGESSPNVGSIAAHLQAVDGNYYQQNLAAANPGLTASQIDSISVSLNQCYRNDAVTAGPIFLRVSLWDITHDLEIVGRDLLIQDPGVIAGTGSNQLAPSTLKMGFDSSSYTTEQVALRIAHVAPRPAEAWAATAVIDNVSVSIDGSYATPSDNFASWALANGVTGGADGDSDNDGIKNLVEYALSLNFAGSDGSAGSLTGNVLSFTKRSEAVTNGDVSYRIETSPNLLDPWTPVSYVLPDVNNGTTITYTLPTGSGKIFARLVVTSAP